MGKSRPSLSAQRVQELLQGDFGLPQDTSQSAGRYRAVQWHRHAALLLGETNVGANLASDLETEPPESVDDLVAREGASRLDQNGITNKMQPDAAGNSAFIKVGSDSLGDLLLQVAQVLPLSGDAASAVGSVPGGD